MFNVQQHIYVGTIRIESISNSSMLQVGTSGGMNAASYVTGQPYPFQYDSSQHQEFFSPSLVPLPNPT